MVPAPAMIGSGTQGEGADSPAMPPGPSARWGGQPKAASPGRSSRRSLIRYRARSHPAKGLAALPRDG